MCICVCVCICATSFKLLEEIFENFDYILYTSNCVFYNEHFEKNAVILEIKKKKFAFINISDSIFVNKEKYVPTM